MSEKITDQDKLNSAIRFMSDLYKDKYGEEPKNTEMMAIRSSAQRVAKGAGFKWVGDGNWRTLQFI